jgi:hypothetical protein
MLSKNSVHALALKTMPYITKYLKGTFLNRNTVANV